MPPRSPGPPKQPKTFWAPCPKKITPRTTRTMSRDFEAKVPKSMSMARSYAPASPLSTSIAEGAGRLTGPRPRSTIAADGDRPARQYRHGLGREQGDRARDRGEARRRGRE